MSLGPRTQILWDTVKDVARLAWTYTLGHPFTWDCAAALVAFVSLNHGWFKPWLPLGCLVGLLGHVYLLRREVKRLTH
jgi:hypothetical protein